MLGSIRESERGAWPPKQLTKGERTSAKHRNDLESIITTGGKARRWAKLLRYMNVSTSCTMTLPNHVMQQMGRLRLDMIDLPHEGPLHACFDVYASVDGWSGSSKVVARTAGGITVEL